MYAWDYIKSRIFLGKDDYSWLKKIFFSIGCVHEGLGLGFRARCKSCYVLWYFSAHVVLCERHFYVVWILSRRWVIYLPLVFSQMNIDIFYIVDIGKGGRKSAYVGELFLNRGAGNFVKHNKRNKPKAILNFFQIL